MATLQAQARDSNSMSYWCFPGWARQGTGGVLSDTGWINHKLLRVICTGFCPPCISPPISKGLVNAGSLPLILTVLGPGRIPPTGLRLQNLQGSDWKGTDMGRNVETGREPSPREEGSQATPGAYAFPECGTELGRRPEKGGRSLYKFLLCVWLLEFLYRINTYIQNSICIFLMKHFVEGLLARAEQSDASQPLLFPTTLIPDEYFSRVPVLSVNIPGSIVCYSPCSNPP